MRRAQCAANIRGESLFVCAWPLAGGRLGTTAGVMQQIASSAQLRASVLRWALFTVPLCIGLGFLSARAAGSVATNAWFETLDKPDIYPPAIAFPIVWSALYALMGFALALIASARGARGREIAMVLFVVQLAVNLSWSPVLFSMHRITWALWIIFVLIVLVILTIAFAWRVRRTAAALLLPYLAWICFASVLNLQLLELNPGADGGDGSGSTVRVQL